MTPRRFRSAAPLFERCRSYAEYMDAREQGSEPDESAAAADGYKADVKGVVVRS